jgi:hypothetical protein
VTLVNRLDGDIIKVHIAELSENGLLPSATTRAEEMSKQYMMVGRSVLKEFYGEWFEGSITEVNGNGNSCTITFDISRVEQKRKKTARLLWELNKATTHVETWTLLEFHLRRVHAKNNTPSLYEDEQVLILAPQGSGALRSTLRIIGVGTVTSDYHCTAPFNPVTGE